MPADHKSNDAKISQESELVANEIVQLETLAAGKGTKLINLVFILLLFFLLLAEAIASSGSFIMVGIVGWLAWITFASWQTPLRVEADGTNIRLAHAFLRWHTSKENIRSLRIVDGKLCFTFGDGQVVVDKGKIQQTKHASENGYHFAWPAHEFSPAGLQRMVTYLACDSSTIAEHIRQTSQFSTACAKSISRAYVTLTWIGVNILVFVSMSVAGGTDLSNMVAWGASSPPLVSSGEWWRLFTAMFLHFSVLHLLFRRIGHGGVAKVRGQQPPGFEGLHSHGAEERNTMTISNRGDRRTPQSTNALELVHGLTPGFLLVFRDVASPLVAAPLTRLRSSLCVLGFPPRCCNAARRRKPPKCRGKGLRGIPEFADVLI